jgi:outer membrane biosynthesis protein TonB
MSIDPDDSPLEEALRNDLPPDETAARMRRRLLAAGIAVGNGMAATTAAAGTTPGVLAGAAAKLGALSWGVKVGFAAAIAIPTLGLLAERSQRPNAAVAPFRAPAQRLPQPVEGALPAATRHEAAPAPREESPAASEPAPRPKRAELELKPPSAEAAASPARPSQLAFEGAEATLPSKATSTLAEETRILDAAFAELAAGNKQRAAELVQEHATRFPAGLLERERERARARLHEVSRGE